MADADERVMAAADEIVDGLVEENENDPWVRLMVLFNEKLEEMAGTMSEMLNRLEILADRCDTLDRSLETSAAVFRAFSENLWLQNDRLRAIEDTMPVHWER